MVKNTKDKMVRKVIVVFGGIFFIYIFAKAIPGSFRSYNLRKQEIELEKKKLELEKMRIEYETKRLEAQSHHKSNKE